MQIEMQKSESGGKNAVKEDTKTRSPKERAQNAEDGSGGKNAAKRNTNNYDKSAILAVIMPVAYYLSWCMVYSVWCINY